MKIITLNMHRTIKVGAALFKIAAYLIVLAIAVHISSTIFVDADYHVEALTDLTEENIIIIDAGHGGEDCGAIGEGGIYEKDLNLEIAMMLGEMLSEKGYAVVYTRTEDKLLYEESENIKGIRKISDLKNRCKIGAEHPKALFLSIHMNSYGDKRYSGLQVYYSENDSTSQNLANSIQTSVRDLLQKSNKRQIKPGREMYLMKNLQNPAVLIECGFITNSEECEKLLKKEYQKELCFAIICGIIEYKNAMV